MSERIAHTGNGAVDPPAASEQYALETRAETLRYLSADKVVRRGESDRLEVGRADIALDMVAGVEKVQVDGTLKEHVGRAEMLSTNRQETTVDGRLSVETRSDTTLMGGAMQDLWQGAVCVTAGMSDDLVIGGGSRMTCAADLWLNGLTGMEEKPFTMASDGAFVEMYGTLYEREYASGFHNAGFASFSGAVVATQATGFKPLMKVALGVRNVSPGGGAAAEGPPPSPTPATPPAPAPNAAGPGETLVPAQGVTNTAASRGAVVTDTGRVFLRVPARADTVEDMASLRQAADAADLSEVTETRRAEDTAQTVEDLATVARHGGEGEEGAEAAGRLQQRAGPLPVVHEAFVPRAYTGKVENIFDAPWADYVVISDDALHLIEREPGDNILARYDELVAAGRGGGPPPVPGGARESLTAPSNFNFADEVENLITVSDEYRHNVEDLRGYRKYIDSVEEIGEKLNDLVQRFQPPDSTAFPSTLSRSEMRRAHDYLTGLATAAERSGDTARAAEIRQALSQLDDAAHSSITYANRLVGEIAEFRQRWGSLPAGIDQAALQRFGDDAMATIMRGEDAYSYARFGDDPLVLRPLEAKRMVLHDTAAQAVRKGQNPLQVLMDNVSYATDPNEIAIGLDIMGEYASEIQRLINQGPPGPSMGQRFRDWARARIERLRAGLSRGSDAAETVATVAPETADDIIARYDALPKTGGAAANAPTPPLPDFPADFNFRSELRQFNAKALDLRQDSLHLVAYGIVQEAQTRVANLTRDLILRLDEPAVHRLSIVGSSDIVVGYGHLEQLVRNAEAAGDLAGAEEIRRLIGDYETAAWKIFAEARVRADAMIQNRMHWSALPPEVDRVALRDWLVSRLDETKEAWARADHLVSNPGGVDEMVYVKESLYYTRQQSVYENAISALDQGYNPLGIFADYSANTAREVPEFHRAIQDLHAQAAEKIQDLISATPQYDRQAISLWVWDGMKQADTRLRALHEDFFRANDYPIYEYIGGMPDEKWWDAHNVLAGLDTTDPGHKLPTPNFFSQVHEEYARFKFFSEMLLRLGQGADPIDTAVKWFSTPLENADVALDAADIMRHRLETEFTNFLASYTPAARAASGRRPPPRIVGNVHAVPAAASAPPPPPPSGGGVTVSANGGALTGSDSTLPFAGSANDPLRHGLDVGDVPVNAAAPDLPSPGASSLEVESPPPPIEEMFPAREGAGGEAAGVPRPAIDEEGAHWIINVSALEEEVALPRLTPDGGSGTGAPPRPLEGSGMPLVSAVGGEGGSGLLPTPGSRFYDTAPTSASGAPSGVATPVQSMPTDFGPERALLRGRLPDTVDVSALLAQWKSEVFELVRRSAETGGAASEDVLDAVAELEEGARLLERGRDPRMVLNQDRVSYHGVESIHQRTRTEMVKGVTQAVDAALGYRAQPAWLDAVANADDATLGMIHRQFTALPPEAPSPGAGSAPSSSSSGTFVRPASSRPPSVNGGQAAASPPPAAAAPGASPGAPPSGAASRLGNTPVGAPLPALENRAVVDDLASSWRRFAEELESAAVGSEKSGEARASDLAVAFVFRRAADWVDGGRDPRPYLNSLNTPNAPGTILGVGEELSKRFTEVLNEAIGSQLIPDWMDLSRRANPLVEAPSPPPAAAGEVTAATPPPSTAAPPGADETVPAGQVAADASSASPESGEVAADVASSITQTGNGAPVEESLLPDFTSPPIPPVAAVPVAPGTAEDLSLRPWARFALLVKRRGRPVPDATVKPGGGEDGTAPAPELPMTLESILSLVEDEELWRLRYPDPETKQQAEDAQEAEEETRQSTPGPAPAELDEEELRSWKTTLGAWERKVGVPNDEFNRIGESSYGPPGWDPSRTMERRLHNIEFVADTLADDADFDVIWGSNILIYDVFRSEPLQGWEEIVEMEFLLREVQRTTSLKAKLSPWLLARRLQDQVQPDAPNDAERSLVWLLINRVPNPNRLPSV